MTLDIGTLVEVGNSIGAHIAAKLDLFHSDERTLTDELCDMFAMWPSALHPVKLPYRLPTVDVTLQKLTSFSESRRGADFELEVSTPRGVKRALFQAKVFDPTRRRLRGSQRKLRRQLRLAEKDIGRDMTFLLLYMPWALMNGTRYRFSTWEQAFVSAASGSSGSYMGVSAIPLSDLSGKGGKWRFRPALRHVGAFGSPLLHLSFSRLLVEMAACRRGVPNSTSVLAQGDDGPLHRADVGLSVQLATQEEIGWEGVERQMTQVLDYPQEFELEL